MWPMPQFQNEYVIVSFFSDSIACSWIQKSKNGLAPLILRAYKRYSLDNQELINLSIFNPSAVKKYIAAFLRTYNKENALVIFSLHADTMEKFVALPTSTPHRADFGVAHSSNTVWGHQYLYSNDHGQFVFYVYAVPRSLILQYQLLAISLQCNLMTITTNGMALLTTYRSVFGKAFRRSQLAVDMMKYNNHLENIVSVDALKRLIMVPNTVVLNDEKLFIAVACGLFCDEQKDLLI